jgi:di/tricarboxylate transporter
LHINDVFIGKVMAIELLIVLALLVAAVAMFALNKPRMDAVALIMLTVLPFTGVISMKEALAGFADPNIVLIAALFVVGEGLVRTGVAQQLGDWLLRTAGRDETRLIPLLMLSVAGLGSVMSSTGVVAIFIPITLRIAQRAGIAPSRLMMPLSVGALISGMLTLVATAPNLVVNSALTAAGSDGFHFFSFTPFGVPVLVLAVLYMLFARRWLSAAGSADRESAPQPSLRFWIEKYRLAQREYRVRVRDDSPVVGKTLEELDLRTTGGVNIIAIERSRRFANAFVVPTAGVELQAGDIVHMDLFKPGVDIGGLQERLGLDALPLSGDYFGDRAQAIGMAELMVSADSTLVGKTIVESRFRSRYHLSVIGLRHGAATVDTPLLDERLQVGDTLLVVGIWRNIERLPSLTSDVLVLNVPTEFKDVLPVAGRAPHAIACLVLMIVLMVTGVVPNVQAAIIASLLMGLFGCVDLDAAYRSIHLKSLVLIVGMLPFSLALQRTGGVELAADALIAATGGSGTWVVLGALFAITSLLGLFISNTATAVLMAPVAIAMATDLQASPLPFVMIVALAASAAFMTPISSPVNTLVVAPGNYRFGDFLRLGVPLTIVVMIVSVILVPLILPLR